jgi:hypothetical protein
MAPKVVAIVGAGCSGSTAAYLLRQAIPEQDKLCTIKHVGLGVGAGTKRFLPDVSQLADTGLQTFHVDAHHPLVKRLVCGGLLVKSRERAKEDTSFVAPHGASSVCRYIFRSCARTRAFGIDI